MSVSVGGVARMIGWAIGIMAVLWLSLGITPQSIATFTERFATNLREGAHANAPVKLQQNPDNFYPSKYDERLTARATKILQALHEETAQVRGYSNFLCRLLILQPDFSAKMLAVRKDDYNAAYLREKIVSNKGIVTEKPEIKLANRQLTQVFKQLSAMPDQGASAYDPLKAQYLLEYKPNKETRFYLTEDSNELAAVVTELESIK